MLVGTRMAIGTYTGDGSTDQGITGVGFQPKYIKIWPRCTSEFDIVHFEKVDENWSTYSVEHGCYATHEHHAYNNRIISFDADGFSVGDGGSDSHPNKNAQVYSYLAFG